jgi:hypothetical protein
MRERIIGYARKIYGDEADLIEQVARLRAVGCEAVYSDEVDKEQEGRRSGLELAIASLCPGNFLMVMRPEIFASTGDEFAKIHFRLRQRDFHLLIFDGEDDRCNEMVAKRWRKEAPVTR